MKLKITDPSTGEYPDFDEIIKEDHWVHLDCRLKLEGFALQDDGTLILCDAYGHFYYAPTNRFKVEVIE